MGFARPPGQNTEHAQKFEPFISRPTLSISALSPCLRLLAATAGWGGVPPLCLFRASWTVASRIRDVPPAPFQQLPFLLLAPPTLLLTSWSRWSSDPESHSRPLPLQSLRYSVQCIPEISPLVRNPVRRARVALVGSKKLAPWSWADGGGGAGAGDANPPPTPTPLCSARELVQGGCGVPRPTGRAEHAACGGRAVRGGRGDICGGVRGLAACVRAAVRRRG
jgi:hypothetical protein